MTIPLSQLKPEELGYLFPIILEDYNSEWPGLFQIECEVIRECLEPQNIFSIEHIGSTAVPGLISKPTIDILVEIKSELLNQEVIERIKKLGYHYIHRPENPAPHMMFVKGYTTKGFEGQAYHVHVRYPGDWEESYFRDYLRINEDAAKEYVILKQRLAEKFRNDREAYTEGKTEFVEMISREAKKFFSGK